MNTAASNTQEWNDVVFENRNKEYGAYVLRQGYPNNVINGSVLGVTVVISFLVVPYIVSNWMKSDLVPAKTVCPPPDFSRKYDVIIKEKPKARLRETGGSGTKSLVPVLTQDSVIDTQHEKPVADQSTDGSLNGNVENPGVGVAVAVGNASDGEAKGPTKPFNVVEKMPQYIGGMEAMTRYMSNHSRYPSSARRTGVEGRVFVQFVVDPLGDVTEVIVIKGIDAACDAEAARVIASLPQWKPGMQQNVAVPVRMVLPITFRLTGN